MQKKDFLIKFVSGMNCLLSSMTMTGLHVLYMTLSLELHVLNCLRGFVSAY